VGWGDGQQISDQNEEDNEENNYQAMLKLKGKIHLKKELEIVCV